MNLLNILSNKAILNKVKGAVVAYSLRKMRGGVTTAIRVRRTFDNTEKDISFVGQDMDISKLLEFTQPNMLDGSDYSSTYPNLYTNPTLTIDTNYNGLADPNYLGVNGYDGIAIPSIDGGQKLVLSGGTNTSQVLIVQDISGFSAGDVVSISCLAKVEYSSGTGGTAQINLSWLDSSSANLGNTGVTSTQATDWTLIKLEGQVAPTSTNKIQLKLRSSLNVVGQTCTFYYKNVVVKKCTSLSNMGLMTQDSNSDGVADGWTFSTNGTGTKDVSVDGQRLKLNSATGQYQNLKVAVVIPCVQGEVLKIANTWKHLKYSGGTSYVVSLAYKNSSDVTVGSVVYFVDATQRTNFYTYIYTNTVPSDATITKCSIGFYVEASTGVGDSGELWLKDINIYKVGSSYVTKWYDQSGNGLDAIQATASLQPRIVNNGVLDDGIYFGGVNHELATTDNSLFKATSQATIGVLWKSTTTQSGIGVAGYTNPASDYRYMQYVTTSSTNTSLYIANPSGNQTTSPATGTYNDGSLVYGIGTFNRYSGGNRLNQYVNGVLRGANAGVDEDIKTGGAYFSVGKVFGGNGFAGYIKEVIAYNQAIDKSISKIHQDAKKKYPTLS